jgi:hypothetical protein
MEDIAGKVNTANLYVYLIMKTKRETGKNCVEAKVFYLNGAVSIRAATGIYI